MGSSKAAMLRSPCKRSWIFSSSIVISKVAIARMSWLSLIGLNSNLTERDGFFYSASTSTQN